MMAGKTASDRDNDSVLEVLTIPRCAGSVLAWRNFGFSGLGYFNIIESIT